MPKSNVTDRSVYSVSFSYVMIQTALTLCVDEKQIRIFPNQILRKWRLTKGHTGPSSVGRSLQVKLESERQSCFVYGFL